MAIGAGSAVASANVANSGNEHSSDRMIEVDRIRGGSKDVQALSEG